jgi:hypothetical protein
MTVEYHHRGKGCCYITKVDGNELTDPEVHYYYCQEPPTYNLFFVQGAFYKKACEEHMKLWEAKYQVISCPFKLTEDKK